MAEIDERIVSMKFDNRQFENGVSTSISTIDKLKKALDFSKQEKAFDELEKTANSVSFAGLQNSLNNIEKWVSPVGSHIVSVFDKAMSYVESKVLKTWNAIFTEAPTQGYQEYELKMDSVQTIMASTGEDIKTVNKYLDELNLYADKTIYSFSDMTANIGKFTNAGVKLEDAVRAIQGVSNVAAVSGAKTQEASRAMYNFAQALGSGAVKLIDWKSIENANMATVEFKNQLIETALAVGTLVEESGQYRSVTTDNAGKVSDLFDATHNFNDALKNQWMTTEVLVETLKKYTDETTEIGKKAFKAATEVKTFTQLIDTLKEAMGSGWTESFQLIIGDFEEAKVVFTMISDVLGGIIDKTSTIRNNLIQLWRDAGGRDELFAKLKEGLETLDKIYDFSLRNIFGDKYDSLVKRTADNLEDVADALNDVTDAEIAAAKQIWTGPNIYGNGAERRTKLTDQFGEEGAARVQKILDDYITKGKEFVKVEQAVDEVTEETSDTFDKFAKTKIGRTIANIVETFKNFGNAALNLIEVGKRIFKIFSASVAETLGFDMMSEDVKSLSEWVLMLTNRLLELVKKQKTIYKIRDAFDFLMKTINKLWEISVFILKNTWKYLGKVVDKIKELIKKVENSDRAQRIFKAFAKILENVKTWLKRTKDAFVDFVDNFKETENGKKVIAMYEKFRDTLKDLAEKGLAWVIEKLEDLANTEFSVPNFDEIVSWLINLPKFAEHIGEKFGMAKNSIIEFFSTLDDENTTPAQRIFGNAIKLVTDLFSKDSRKRVAERVKDLWTGVLEGIASVKLSDVIGAVNLLYFIRLVNAIVSAIKSFKSNSKSFKKAVKSVVTGLTDIESAIAKSIKADVFVKLASAIAIIAGAMIALTLVDQNKLSTAAAVIILIMLTLGTVLKNLENIINKAIDGMRIDTITSMFVVLGGVALGILSFAVLLKTVYEVFMGIYSLYDKGLPIYTLMKMMLAFGALISVIITLVAAVGLLSIVSKDIKKEAAISIVAVAAAIYIAAQAFAVLAKTIDKIEKFDEVMIALIALVASLSLLTLLSQKAGSMVGVGGGLILMAIGLAALVPPLAAFMCLIDHYGSTFSIALGSMGAILFVMTALAAALSKYTMGVVSFNVMAGALIKIAAAFIILALAIAPLSKQLKPLGLIFAGILVLALASTEMAVPLMMFARGLLGVAASIAIVALAFGVFVGAIWLLGEALPHLANGFLEMVAVLNDGRPQIMEALGLLIQGFAYTLTESIPYIVTFIGKLILGIIQGLRDGIKDLLLVIVDILDSIVMFLTDIMDPLCERIIKLLAEFIYSLAVSVEKNSAYLGAAVTRFITALIDILWSVLVTAFADLVREIEKSSWGKKLLDKIGISADEMLQDLADKTAERTKQWEMDREMFREAGERNKQAAIDAYQQGFTSGGQNDASYYASIYGGKAAEKGAEQGAENVKESLFSGFGDGEIASFINSQLQMGNVSMFTNFEDMTSMCQQYSIDIPESLQNEEGFALAMSNNNDAWNTEFESNYPQTKEEGKEMSEEGANGAGSQTWRYARSAQNCCDAFLSILWKNRERMYERGQQCAQAAAEGFEKELEIRSPSRRFMRDGEFSILGFVEGLKNNERLAETSSEDLAKSVITSFTTPLDKIGAILRGEEEFDPTIRPVLDLSAVREGAGEINGYFANRSVELASINGRLNANALAARQNLLNDTDANNKAVVASINALRGDVDRLNTTMANTELVMDTGAVVGQLKRPMDSALGRMNVLKGRRN